MHAHDCRSWWHLAEVVGVVVAAACRVLVAVEQALPHHIAALAVMVQQGTVHAAWRCLRRSV